MSAMKIIDIRPRGYCKGVARAIITARETRARYPEVPVTVLGSIVHNRHVVEALEKEGVATVPDDGRSRLEQLEAIDEGVVIFSAHGVSDKVRARAKAKGLTVVDATCEDVSGTAALIDRWTEEEGGDVIYIGKPGHPEAVGVCEGRDKVRFVHTAEEIAALAGRLQAPVLVTNQTTLSTHDIAALYDVTRRHFPDAVIADEICSATRMRQEAVKAAEGLDTLVVVGDPQSNNTAMLAAIGRDAGVARVLRIETVKDLETIAFGNDDTIGITSGASTPTAITEAVSRYLRQWAETGRRPASTGPDGTEDIL